MIAFLVEIIINIVAEIAGEIISRSLWYLAGFLWIKSPEKISPQRFYKAVEKHNFTDKSKENFIK